MKHLQEGLEATGAAILVAAAWVTWGAGAGLAVLGAAFVLAAQDWTKKA